MWATLAGEERTGKLLHVVCVFLPAGGFVSNLGIRGLKGGVGKLSAPLFLLVIPCVLVVIHKRQVFDTIRTTFLEASLA